MSYRGVNKLRRKLRRMGPEMTAEVASVIQKGAQAIEFDMITGVPVDTGDTRADIQSQVSRDGLTAQIGFLGKNRRLKDVGRVFKPSSRAYVARFLEFGTKGSPEHNIPPQPARPFIAPAFDSNKDWIKRDVRKAISNVIRDAGGSDDG